uniref:Uncharacterized protein n=1 Tax=Glycine max TaxID=3847 RepID=C6TF58_SOYBN|nr:unknown [Glycine max]
MQLIQYPFLPSVSTQHQHPCPSNHTSAMTPSKFRRLPRNIEDPPGWFFFRGVQQKELRW